MSPVALLSQIARSCVELLLSLCFRSSSTVVVIVWQELLSCLEDTHAAQVFVSQLARFMTLTAKEFLLSCVRTRVRAHSCVCCYVAVIISPRHVVAASSFRDLDKAESFSWTSFPLSVTLCDPNLIAAVIHLGPDVRGEGFPESPVRGCIHRPTS